MDTDSRHPAVYLLASQRLGTLYIGVTSDLVQRVWQHRQGLADGFTARHGVKRLVWYEQHETMPAAIAREKALKHWRREWKIRLIEEGNPGWRDLWEEITGQARHPRTPAVTLAKARGHGEHPLCPAWVPAFAGMTGRGRGDDGTGGQRGSPPARG